MNGTDANPGFRYIAIEGPIGVGKTTLARRLAGSYAGQLLLEAPEDNPFLPRFYRNPRPNALPTQLYFLLQRARQVEGLRQADLFDSLHVADFMVEKDRLFAQMTLDHEELTLYEEVYRRVLGDALAPDLVIYLQAPVPVLQERIARRGVPYEAAMDERYLQRVVEGYTRFFYRYESAPLVVVNAAEIDLAHGDTDYDLLLRELSTLRKGRHYLNPLPF